MMFLLDFGTATTGKAWHWDLQFSYLEWLHCAYPFSKFPNMLTTIAVENPR
jgi:hypothetical protein